MKKSIFTLVISTLFFTGCGGGSSSSSSSENPRFIISSDNVDVKVGETKDIRIKVADINRDSIVETNITSFPDIQSKPVIDYVKYTISNENDKDIQLLVYGANSGTTIVELKPDFNPTNDSNKSKRATYPNSKIYINVLKNSSSIDIANDDINIDNASSGVTYISKLFKFVDGDILGKLYLVTPSNCGIDTFINETVLNFEKDTKKLLINLNLFRYNTQGDREFSKYIKSVDATRIETRENNELIVIPEKAKEIVGMDFALTGIELDYYYNLEVETDMCQAEFKLKLSDLLLDLDLDGVSDDVDFCKNTPLGSPVDEKGCSTDLDGDGVEDGNDLCPNTPLGTKVNSDGCSDRDGDGIADVDDKCPDEFGTIENGGCPDSDGDGIIDNNDSCPLVAGDGLDGCPIPTPEPTVTPSASPTVTPSANPTVAPSASPTVAPSASPTVTPSASPTVTPSASPTVTPKPTSVIPPVDDDTNACTTNGGYSVATHTQGESSFSNGLIYFRTLTPYPLSLYYKAPTSREFERAIDLSEYQLPGTNYKFFLEISPTLAEGGTFYIGGNGICYKAKFPTIEQLNRGIFPNKNLTVIK